MAVVIATESPSAGWEARSFLSRGRGEVSPMTSIYSMGSIEVAACCLLRHLSLLLGRFFAKEFNHLLHRAV